MFFNPRTMVSPRMGRTVISKSELARMKTSAIILSKQDIENNRAKAAASRAIVQAKSRARKEYLVRKGEETKRKAPKSDIQLLKIAENQSRLAAAREQTEEELDCVKHLNTLGSRAAAFTIRKQQLAEKEEREEREKYYDERQNLVMEINRLKLQEAEEAEDARKRVQRYADKDILMGQIANRAVDRKKRQLQVQVDMELQMSNMRKNEEEEVEKAKYQIARQKQIQLEVIASNEKEAALKLRKAQILAEEDERIVQYQREQTAKGELADQRAAAKAVADELRIAKLRAQMQKSADTQSELDELRAKRAQEQKERDFRGKDREIAEKKVQILAEMSVAREHQNRQKKVAAMIERKEQEEEYLKNLSRAEDQRQVTIAYDRKKAQERLDNKEIILAQINEKQRKRVKQRAYVSAEGKKINGEFMSELDGLEKIRNQKIQTLKDQGVDEVYLTEMQRADMRKLQMR